VTPSSRYYRECGRHYRGYRGIPAVPITMQTSTACTLWSCWRTVDVGESSVDVGRHAAEDVADLLRIVTVDAHATAPPVLPQSPVLVAAEQVDSTVEAAQPHRRGVDARYQRLDAELRQRQTGLREVGHQLVALELPESAPWKYNREPYPPKLLQDALQYCTDF